MQPISISIHLPIVFLKREKKKENEFRFLDTRTQIHGSKHIGMILDLNKLTNIHMRLRMHELNLCILIGNW